jgi:DNA replication initiation complex subunit (GINS family)
MKNYENLTKEEKELYDAVKNLVEITRVNTKECAAGHVADAAWLVYGRIDIANKYAPFVNIFKGIPDTLSDITKTAKEVEKDTYQLYLEAVEIFTRIKKLLEISEEVEDE